MTTVRINEEVLKMRFEEVYSRFMDGKITAEEASKGLRDHPEIVAHLPRGVIIIGRSNDWEESKLKALHRLNRQMTSISIMTYDQLIAQGERLLEIITP